MQGIAKELEGGKNYAVSGREADKTRKKGEERAKIEGKKEARLKVQSKENKICL